MTPVRRDDEKYAGAGERDSRHDRSDRSPFEGWELSGNEPDAGNQDQEEANLGEGDARLTTKREHRDNGSFPSFGCEWNGSM